MNLKLFRRIKKSPELKKKIMALFNDMQTLSYSMVMFFATVNHLSRLLMKRQFTLTRSKGHISQLQLIDFGPFCFF